MIVFSALTPLVGRQEKHPACKKFSYEVLACIVICLNYTRCKRFADDPADATATPSSIASL